MADCHHLYEWRSDRFFCIMCGHERRGRPRIRRARRRVGITTGVMAALSIVVLAYWGVLPMGITQETYQAYRNRRLV